MKNRISMKFNSEFQKEDGSVDYSVYAEFFADNIQYSEKIEGEKVFEGLTYDDFLIQWNKNVEKNVNEIIKFMGIKKENKKEEKRFNQLTIYQKELSAIGIDLDFANLYFLCYFIMKVIKFGYLALLKPTPKETIDLIKSITKISFTNEDGSIVETSYKEIINPIKNALDLITEADDTTYEVEKLVSIEEITNQEIFQTKFVGYLSTFLREYFPNAIRRKNSYIVPLEQTLVMYMLSYFGLGNEGLSLERYRQLRMNANNIKEHFGHSYIKGVGLLPIGYVRYEDWKGKKLNFIRKDKKPYKFKLYEPKIGEKFVFSKASVVHLLVKK